MAFLCVHDARDAPDDQTALGAICVHGFFANMPSAREYVVQLSAQQPEVQSYIIDDCYRWIAVQEPVSGTAIEEEEINAPENEDEENGKMGSVCDLRKGTSNRTSEVSDLFLKSDSNKKVTKAKQEVRNQKSQLDELLRGVDELNADINNLQQYGAVRDQLAILRAFQRKIQHLIQVNVEKLIGTREDILRIGPDDSLTPRNGYLLHQKHSDYGLRYRENYQRALKQSETDPEMS